MERERTTAALALVLGLLVLATAASGITGMQQSASSSSTTGLGVGEGNGTGSGDGNQTGSQMQGGDLSSTTSSGYLQTLITAVLAASAVLGVALIGLILYREGLAGLKRLLAAAVRNLLVFGMVLVGIVGFLFVLEMLLGNGGGGISGAGSPSGVLENAGGSASSGGFPLQPVLLVVALVVVLVAVALVLVSRDGLLDRFRTRAAGVFDEDDRDEVATTGGTVKGSVEVAVEDVPATNGVYRAWRTLAESVTSETITTTPAEVARDAVEAGYDERRVGELTSLFREVRYNAQPVTDDRERRARDAADDLQLPDDR